MPRSPAFQIHNARPGLRAKAAMPRLVSVPPRPWLHAGRPAGTGADTRSGLRRKETCAFRVVSGFEHLKRFKGLWEYWKNTLERVIWLLVPFGSSWLLWCLMALVALVAFSSFWWHVNPKWLFAKAKLMKQSPYSGFQTFIVVQCSWGSILSFGWLLSKPWRP